MPFHQTSKNNLQMTRIELASAVWKTTNLLLIYICKTRQSGIEPEIFYLEGKSFVL